ncbi:M55 family metallopeptidase [Maledivibacter halophilus]|uniref:D-amino peptidase n=1 Tax=Maledivibacter halophilus TaxID=36842 RepID=A0A1T5IDM4_9FIRM|nr:M55 family metallopeptidase [Maledivibacter halophilus]SKC37123.1 D-amino peptidase [Maledivibacter halophilus]
MKIFISADIEGVTGITTWEEARKISSEYQYFAQQMTKEVAAACEGANEAGATEILIKDAHGTGRNVDQSYLPENTSLIRGWSGDPYKMVQGLDESFDAIAFIGYHSYGGSNENPLAHTMNSSLIDYVKLNGEYCSEFLLHAYLAIYLGVPIAFLSGDRGICHEAKKFNKNIITVPVNEGKGSSTINIHPNKSIELIKNGMEEALKGNLSKNKVELPKNFSLEIRYNFHGNAYKNSFYPGAVQKSPKSILFEANDYFEIMRAASFLI